MIHMSKKKDKMFMGVAGLSLVALMAMTMSGCAPQQAPSNETDDSSTTVVVEENQNAADDAARTAEEELSNPLPLEVVDFGWFPSENNMVDFSVAVNNPNQYVSADDITLTVNGLDEAGNVFFTQDISLAAIAPNSDYVFSYVVGDTSDNPKAPHDIAITANVAEGGWSVYNESEEVSFTVDDVAVAPSDTRAWICSLETYLQRTQQFKTQTVKASRDRRWLMLCCMTTTARWKADTSTSST